MSSTGKPSRPVSRSLISSGVRRTTGARRAAASVIASAVGWVVTGPRLLVARPARCGATAEAPLGQLPELLGHGVLTREGDRRVADRRAAEALADAVHRVGRGPTGRRRVACRAGGARRRGRAASRAAAPARPRGARPRWPAGRSRAPGVVVERGAGQVAGDLGEGQGGGHRGAQGDRAGDAAHAAEPHPHGDGASGALAGPQAGGHPVGEVAERDPQDVVGGEPAAEGGLGTDRGRRAGRCRCGGGRRSRRASRAWRPRPRRADGAAARAGRWPARRWRGCRRRPACASVTGPTPHRSRTGRGSRKACSVPASTTTRPSGLATCEATLARCLVVATPTEMGSPSSSRTRRAHGGGHLRRRAEEVDRAADVGEGLVDGDALDERREVAQHVDGGVAEALVLAEVAADEDAVRGTAACAFDPDMPPCTPKALASYDAASTTPPPTAIGRPRSDGSRSCSTEA